MAVFLTEGCNFAIRHGRRGKINVQSEGVGGTKRAADSCKSQPNLRRPQLLVEEEEDDDDTPLKKETQVRFWKHNINGRKI